MTSPFYYQGLTMYVEPPRFKATIKQRLCLHKWLSSKRVVFGRHFTSLVVGYVYYCNKCDCIKFGNVDFYIHQGKEEWVTAYYEKSLLYPKYIDSNKVLPSIESFRLLNDLIKIPKTLVDLSYINNLMRSGDTYGEYFRWLSDHNTIDFNKWEDSKEHRGNLELCEGVKGDLEITGKISEGSLSLITPKSPI